ncbi:MAG: uroporphyrinogen decarboxylase family protein [Planctomycetota bacterium]|jgi:hypothetical protein
MVSSQLAIVDQRAQRWRDFMDMSKPPRHLFFVNYWETDRECPLPIPEQQPDRIDYACFKYEDDLKRAEWLDDDFVPFLYGITGTEVFAEAFGCSVHYYESGDQNPCARPLITKPEEVAKLTTPDLSGTMARHFEYHDALHQRFPEGRLQLIDIQSPMDIAALIWEKTAFYMAIYDAPEAVKDLAEMTKELLIAYFDEFFARYGTDYVAHYPFYPMSGGLTLSEDEIGAVNTEMFEEFFLPSLTELSDRYGGIGIHCCANARHQWPGLKKIPNLKLLNLVQPVEELLDAYDYFADVTCQMHDGAWWNEPEKWLESLPNNGCRALIGVSPESKDQALEWAAMLREHCGD